MLQPWQVIEVEGPQTYTLPQKFQGLIRPCQGKPMVFFKRIVNLGQDLSKRKHQNNNSNNMSLLDPSVSGYASGGFVSQLFGKDSH